MTVEKILPCEELRIISHVTGVDVQQLRLEKYNLSPIQQSKIDALIKQRVQEKTPLDYLFGVVDFFGLSLKVTNDVLIPRPETEILVEKALSEISGEGVAFDLCCGSGCIGLAVKEERPFLDVILSDISPSAIKVAKENGKRNGLDVQYNVGHLFDGFKGVKIDYLLCNPPYIPQAEYEGLAEGVKNFEPKLALIGGDDGLMFYKMIERSAKKVLNNGAKCFFEIGYNQGNGVREVFSGPTWKNQVVSCDYAGHDRFFFLEFESKNGI